MTRVNAGIPVEQLHKKHVFAEFREITRIPNAIRSGRYSFSGQPKTFTLGTGHVKFFYDKLLYLQLRYLELYERCLELGIDCQSKLSAFDGLPSKLMNDWEPSEADNNVVRNRLKQVFPDYYPSSWS